MCEPVTIGVLVASAAAASVAQQQQQADAANKFEKAVYGQRKAAAIDTFAALREREFQERERASADIRRVTSQARAAAGAAKLQALESGVGGRSVNTLLADFERAELTGVTGIRSNLAATSRQLQEQARAAGRLDAPGQVIGPLDTPLGIAASALNVGASGVSAGMAARPNPATL